SICPFYSHTSIAWKKYNPCRSLGVLSCVAFACCLHSLTTRFRLDPPVWRVAGASHLQSSEGVQEGGAVSTPVPECLPLW
ncbi:hypothetical protein ATANTOWER_026987, partial [Ataeniobius toweri]|nr:hypothetical protein [Ataeniobius toweri]